MNQECGAVECSCATPTAPQPELCGEEEGKCQKTHIITFSFDDGFRKSSERTAQIFEKHCLHACFNVTVDGVIPTEYEGVPRGGVKLWNELRCRKHEIMPHGMKHAKKWKLPFDEASKLIQDCLDRFAKDLPGFDPKTAVFNFPHNRATKELEEWLPRHVRAFRATRPLMKDCHSESGINPLPYPDQPQLTCWDAPPPRLV